jgi:hypothetical protein
VITGPRLTPKQVRLRNEDWIRRARLLVEERSEQARLDLDVVSYVAFRIGCSILQAEWLVKETTGARTLRLTAAQLSALECAGLEERADDLEPDEQILRAAWRGRQLEVTDATREAIFRALTDRSNAEDADAQQRADAAIRRQAAGAAAALANLASAVLKGGA